MAEKPIIRRSHLEWADWQQLVRLGRHMGCPAIPSCCGGKEEPCEPMAPDGWGCRKWLIAQIRNRLKR